MPKIALISDAHGNLEALVAVLRDIDSEAGVDLLACLGDAVGYGPDPAPCVDLIARVCDAVVVGNHDKAVLMESEPANFNPTAAHSLAVTRGLLSDRHLDTIGNWPERDTIAGIDLVHASFGRRRLAYVLNARRAADSFSGMGAKIGVFGHTHMPSMFACPIGDALDAEPAGATIRSALPLPADVRSELPASHRVLLNPGSVGQPRDRNPDAAWGMLDTDAMTFRIRRVRYDIDEVERKIRDRGLPDFLHKRLRVGA